MLAFSRFALWRPLAFVMVMFCCHVLLAQKNNPAEPFQPSAASVRVDELAQKAYEAVFENAGLAFEIATAGYELADSLNYAFGRGKCQYDLGLALLYQGYAPEALEFLYAALPPIEEAGDPFWLFQNYSAFAYVGWDQRDYRQSLRYLRQAEPEARTLADTNLIISCLSDFGETYLRKNEWDSAYTYCLQAFELAEATQDTFQLGVVQGQLGNILVQQGRYAEGLTFSRHSLPFSRAGGWNTRYAYLYMARAYLGLNQPDSAILACRFSLRAAREGSYLDEAIPSAHESLSDAFFRLGNFDSAMQHARRRAETFGQLMNSEKIRRIEGLHFGQELHENRLEQARREAAFEADLRRQRFEKYAGFTGFGLFLFFSALLYQRFRVSRRQERTIAQEKSKSDALLRNILPEAVAEELKQQGSTRAVRYEETTVLFADFADFTRISRGMDAKALVDELNACFSRFDAITAEFGVEKIKTIGDSYLCVAGIPNPRPDHLEAMLNAAFGMLEAMKERRESLRQLGREGFKLRIGLHTGPLVAGVVGVRKFAYDVWGSTVNMASRVESNGEVGQVNVSEAIWERLRHSGQYTSRAMEHQQVKGIGAMRTYVLQPIVRPEGDAG